MHSALASQNCSLGRYVLWGCTAGVDHPSRKARVEAARHGVFPHGISPDESANFERGFSPGFERAHHSDLKIAAPDRVAGPKPPVPTRAGRQSTWDH